MKYTSLKYVFNRKIYEDNLYLFFKKYIYKFSKDKPHKNYGYCKGI